MGPEGIGRPDTLTVVSVAISMLLAVTLLVAAVAKLRDPAPFRATLRTLTGARAARVLTVAVPVTEALLAAALIAGVCRAAARGGARADARPSPPCSAGSMRVPCNCFGARSDVRPAAARARNLLLAAGALALVVWPAEALWHVPAGDCSPRPPSSSAWCASGGCSPRSCGRPASA